jgi:ppGpp synthetase/RelA/SpoT-type nucleotidyltranferase
MSLARMQDIGGCRAIFPTVEDVYTCQKNMLASRMQHNPPKNHKDYIESPKESGYRGIHIVYEFTSKSQKYATYNGMLVEVQLRTVVQHAWATAVETVGIFTGESLKSST